MDTMKNAILAAATSALLCVLAPAAIASASDATVNVTAKKQVIDGFGASSAWCGTINDKVMNSLYGDLGYSILRVRIEENIGDNWKNGPYTSWAAELANAKKAIAKGAIVFASPWNPPASLRVTMGTSNAAFGIEDAKFASYRDYLNAYVKYFKDNGADLHAISIQNEPDYAKDWTYWSPTQVHDFILNYGASINTKLISAESFSYLKNLFDPTLNDAKALENVDIIGTHLYGTSVSNFAYPLFESKARPLGKKVWMTEHYLNEDDDMTKTIMPVAKEIHDCMVTGNMSAYVYWWITWANGLAKTDGTIFKRAYVIGQFAKNIRPGYTRVDATANPATNVYVSAYAGSDKVVIVAVNTGTGAATQKFNLQNVTLSKVSVQQTTSSTNMASLSDITVSGNAFTANLPAQSITTFVGTTPTTPTSIAQAGSAQGKMFHAGVADGTLHIAPDAALSSYDVVVRLLDGRTVRRQEGVRGNLDIPLQAHGMHVIEVQSNGSSQKTLILNP